MWGPDGTHAVHVVVVGVKAESGAPALLAGCERGDGLGEEAVQSGDEILPPVGPAKFFVVLLFFSVVGERVESLANLLKHLGSLLSVVGVLVGMPLDLRFLLGRLELRNRDGPPVGIKSEHVV